ncbi:MAG TPA: hypothetical protein DD376_00070 [Sutterella sp.]|nr:hypothetical protein [Sutterella sp.]
MSVFGCARLSGILMTAWLRLFSFYLDGVRKASGCLTSLFCVFSLNPAFFLLSSVLKSHEFSLCKAAKIF